MYIWDKTTSTKYLFNRLWVERIAPWCSSGLIHLVEVPSDQPKSWRREAFTWQYGGYSEILVKSLYQGTPICLPYSETTDSRQATQQWPVWVWHKKRSVLKHIEPYVTVYDANGANLKHFTHIITYRKRCIMEHSQSKAWKWAFQAGKSPWESRSSVTAPDRLSREECLKRRHAPHLALWSSSKSSLAHYYFYIKQPLEESRERCLEYRHHLESSSGAKSKGSEEPSY